jgi:hypothetical protein
MPDELTTILQAASKNAGSCYAVGRRRAPQQWMLRAHLGERA